jgi:hypothetical protein
LAGIFQDSFTIASPNSIRTVLPIARATRDTVDNWTSSAWCLQVRDLPNRFSGFPIFKPLKRFLGLWHLTTHR